jgi:hypothetical protein
MGDESMPMPGLVVVKEVTQRLEADTVAAFLRSKGLDAVVNADDVGGEIPSLDQTRGVRVLVPESEAEEAKKFLAAAEASSTDD